MLHAAILARRAVVGGPTAFAQLQASRAFANKAPVNGGSASRKGKTLASESAPKPSSPPAKDASAEPNAATAPPPIVEQPIAERVPHPEDASAEKPTPVPPSNLKSLDFTSLLDTQQVAAPAGAAGRSGEGGRTGARSSKGSLSSLERKRRMLGRATMAALGIALGVGAFSLGNEWTEEELYTKKLTLETAPNTRWGRTQSRFQDIFNVFSEPQWEDLLPPPLPAPHQKPLTLVVSLDDLLITSTWDRTHGWRTAKRPGVDYFLAYLSQFYEIVIWTSQQSYTAMPIIEKLDPYRFFTMYHLFRESTKSLNGQPVKDLSYLNRDLSKVIILDTHPEHVRTHPGNAVVLPKWKGQPGDRGLIAMIPFLESIGIYKPADVRPILGAYEGKDIPVEYAKFEAAAKETHIADFHAKRASGGGRGLNSGGFTISGLFASSGSAPVVPPTYLEQKRAEAQAQYKEEMAYLEANKPTLDKMLQEERDAMMREGAGSLLGIMQAFGGAPPLPKDGEAGASAPPVPASAGQQAKAE